MRLSRDVLSSPVTRIPNRDLGIFSAHHCFSRDRSVLSAELAPRNYVLAEQAPRNHRLNELGKRRLREARGESQQKAAGGNQNRRPDSRSGAQDLFLVI